MEWQGKIIMMQVMYKDNRTIEKQSPNSPHNATMNKEIAKVKTRDDGENSGAQEQFCMGVVYSLVHNDLKQSGSTYREQAVDLFADRLQGTNGTEQRAAQPERFSSASSPMRLYPGTDGFGLGGGPNRRPQRWTSA